MPDLLIYPTFYIKNTPPFSMRPSLALFKMKKAITAGKLMVMHLRRTEKDRNRDEKRNTDEQRNILVAFSGIPYSCDRSTSCHHKFEGLLEKRRLSSNTRMAYDIDQSAMQDLISTPAPRGASLGSLETLVFVLATAQQGGAEQMVLLSTLCPHTKLYTITLPFAQMRGHEDSGMAAMRALVEAGIKSTAVERKGQGVAIHPGGVEAQVIVESISIHSFEGISTATAQESTAVVMAPVAKLRAALMNLSAEGRVIDENLFFFAAGMEAAAGGIKSGGIKSRTSGRSPAEVAATAQQGALHKLDFVSKFGPAVGAVWMIGAILYAVSCMGLAY